jgi:hypothetical protein
MKNYLNIILFLIAISAWGQKSNFVSDNGFSGTFELGNNNQVKSGSIIVEKFKTSVGEFSDTDLQEGGVVFPWSCLDCAFEIAKMGSPVQIKSTTGRGFANVIKAAKSYVQNQQENKAMDILVKSVSVKSTLNEQLKLAYSSYSNFVDKKKVDDLIIKIKKGEFLSHTIGGKTEDTISSKEEVISKEKEQPKVETEKIKQVKEQIPETIEVAEITELPKIIDKEVKELPAETIEFKTQETSERNFKNDKCRNMIKKLESRLSIAKENEDFLIVNEVKKALQKQYEKCL